MLLIKLESAKEKKRERENPGVGSEEFMMELTTSGSWHSLHMGVAAMRHFTGVRVMTFIIRWTHCQVTAGKIFVTLLLGFGGLHSRFDLLIIVTLPFQGKDRWVHVAHKTHQGGHLRVFDVFRRWTIDIQSRWGCGLTWKKRNHFKLWAIRAKPILNPWASWRPITAFRSWASFFFFCSCFSITQVIIISEGPRDTTKHLKMDIQTGLW